MESTTRMWGERGLIATFFIDLSLLDDMAEIETLLQLAGLLENGAGTPVKFNCVVEPDFGNTGFGHPDAICSVEYADRKSIIVVEAKRTSFANACTLSLQRGQVGINSKLNGQLELDYCLSMALSNFKNDARELVEPQWVLSTPYNEDRRGKLRSVANPNVLHELATPFGGQPIEHYRYLVITADDENPLDDSSSKLLPQLFVPEMSGITMNVTDKWHEFRGQFGWLNYGRMKQFIGRVQDRLPRGSLFLPTFELNEANMGAPEPEGPDEIPLPPREPADIALEPPLTGIWIVDYEGTPCHLSCQRFSYALRDLRNGRWVELDRGKKNEKRMRDLLARVTVLGKGPKMGLENVSEWTRLLRNAGDGEV